MCLHIDWLLTEIFTYIQISNRNKHILLQKSYEKI